jgi:uncharacterized protein (TIGR00255 family)
MTGYASVQNQSANLPHGAGGDTLPNGRLGVEIRSVNSRFLDLSFRLPDELRSMEPVLRQMLTGGLKRGKVELRAAIEPVAARLSARRRSASSSTRRMVSDPPAGDPSLGRGFG